jgi:hypothetical protein
VGATGRASGTRFPRAARPPIPAQRLQCESVLKFAEIEGRWLCKLVCRAIHLPKNLFQVEKYLDGGRKPDSQRAAQVAVVAAVGTEAIRREMPVVRTRVAWLRAQVHGAAMFAQHERLLSALVQSQAIPRPQVNPIVRRVRRLDDFRVRVGGTNAFRQSPTGLRATAPFGQHDSRWPKQGRGPRPIVVLVFVNHQHDAGPLCRSERGPMTA